MNNKKLATPLLDELQNEQGENPLFKIARKQHNEAFLTWQYDFLHMTPENEKTFILGFCNGVSYATGIFSKQIEEMKQKLKELQDEKAPTLERQD